MIRHQDILDEKGTNRLLLSLIKDKQITVGANKSLKIYGKLNCKSGKRMKTQNRVFFKDIQEAVVLGFRPCGHCMRLEYLEWKNH
ncbi:MULTISPECIES: Ada metal-binding domain-containing protein [unclassified Arcicella]|uniref:Ada metal-binding domain-containing protein n=1 Tax=unclassified Arcicella TaxID=2644986 RepID=UPI00285FE234|nr:MULTISPECIES: Ada metal-binding domain-containing protein [unclassified Arcicella]MDR6564424.1 methylphosphotriester-DNA--protein-cysteine methyltransferase [Arcicella sp. BE51]MDR6814283.1 methylphosphotriester-DNA--protein-cysteine methyltransferase [Arcicella sp. BE140]MDR6825695.1 methylphosphotriester-DNA--protein-cysteine methyltransferase [Arcicella sp. BE139]